MARCSQTDTRSIKWLTDLLTYEDPVMLKDKAFVPGLLGLYASVALLVVVLPCLDHLKNFPNTHLSLEDPVLQEDHRKSIRR